MKATISRSLLNTLLCPLLYASAALSQSAQAGVELDLAVSGGLRNDDLSWTIAGEVTGQNPNIISELIWSDLAIPQAKIQGNLLFNDKFVFRGSAAGGQISDGENNDFDYFGDNRTSMFSWSQNSAGGRVADLSVGLGSRIKGVDEKNQAAWALNWLAGYSRHEQNLTMTNGYQMYSTSLPLGPFDDLNSTYNAKWEGPWLGADIWLSMSEKLSLTLTFEYHIADYTANANWNLREEFAHPVSYEHFAKGYGVFWSLGANYQVSQPLRLAALVEQHNWSTKEGLDRTYFVVHPITGVPGNYSAETQLNEVSWVSTAVMLQATYSIK